MIVGTAGHVDHGKTALVRALTGIDTDRLPEEKRRGITIALGFAPLVLPDGRVLGVVDVPGHEAFVRTMLAGATGIELALLVVAADEGVMPQTREHVAILGLLGVRAGVVALTKADLVDDPDWMALVADDVGALLAGTALGAAGIVPVSALAGTGLDALRTALAACADALPAREDGDLVRLPVDRAFTVRGTGTVVTGTMWSGSIARDAALRLYPGGAPVRVRALHAHGAPVERVGPGTRAAVALAGLEVADVARGAVLVADDGWLESRTLRADVMLLDTASRVVGARTRLRFHLGTSEVGARVVTTGGPLHPGQRKAARLVLDAAVLARTGDRFVLRLPSPAETIGGGVVTDAQPPGRRVRLLAADVGSVEARLASFAREAGASGLARRGLAVRLGLPPARVAEVVAASGLVAAADRLVHPDALTALGIRALAVLDADRAAEPLEPGTSLQHLRAGIGATPEVADAVLRQLGAAIEVQGGLVRRRGWTPSLDARQVRLREQLREVLEAAGAEPPSVADLVASHGSEVPAMLRLLGRSGAAVAVEGDRWFARAAVDALVHRMRQATPPGGVHSPAALRDLLGLSRKFLIPFLEWCDANGVTERRPEGRTVRPA